MKTLISTKEARDKAAKVAEISRLAVEISNTHKMDVFTTYMSHVDTLDIFIYYEGWSNNSDAADVTYTVHMSDTDDNPAWVDIESRRDYPVSALSLIIDFLKALNI